MQSRSLIYAAAGLAAAGLTLGAATAASASTATPTVIAGPTIYSGPVVLCWDPVLHLTVSFEAPYTCPKGDTQATVNEQGVPGPQGPAGATGPAGPAGATGPAGPAGANGAPGSNGAPGAQGVQGPPGQQGPAGQNGTQGPPGPPGTPGTNGTDGATGPAGPQGPAGPAGATGPQGPAGPAGSSGSSGLFTEVDNGAQFSLSTSLNLGDTSAAGATYADAGVVQDIGTLNSLTQSSLGYAVSGEISLAAENLWIGDGPQASTPGVYPLSGIDFCYGLGNATDTAFYMTGANCDGTAGQTLTLAQIQAAFTPDSAAPYSIEAYAWVGITSSNANVGLETDIEHLKVLSIDGHAVNEDVGIQNGSDGVLTPFVTSS
jgi:hypothetical protein